MVWSGAVDLDARVRLGGALSLPAGARADGRRAGRGGGGPAGLYPFAVFFSAPYTEGLFLLPMLGAWWHLRRDERWPAFALGTAGRADPAQRLPALDSRWRSSCWRRFWQHGRCQRPPGGWASLADRLIVAAAPGLGMLIYSAYVYDMHRRPVHVDPAAGGVGPPEPRRRGLPGRRVGVGRPSRAPIRYATSNVPTS